MISSLNLEIIDICNLQCRICDIWKNKTKHILLPQEIEKILDDIKDKKDLDITITGGEPFLHPDIHEVFLRIHKKWNRIHTISTNWILKKKVLHLLEFCVENSIAFPSIHISIDWYEKNHDLQRGIKWAFKKSIDTIISIKKQYPLISIKIKFTITNDNIIDIEKMFHLASRLWVLIAFKPVQNDQFYTNKINTPLLLDKKNQALVVHILNGLYLKEDNEYVSHLLYYLKFNRLLFRCATIEKSIFIMANGDIFPCTNYPSIGNIREQPLSEIIWNKKHQEIHKQVLENNCQKCFSPHWSYKTIV